MVKATHEVAYFFDMERVTVYIDGFNFYYALKRSKLSNPAWKRYYWIDFVKLFSQFLGKEQILQKVVYFTATPLSSQKSSRQGTLFNANKLINGNRFEVVRGKYTVKVYFPPNSFCNDLNYNMIQHKKKVVRLANNILKFANSVLCRNS